MLTYPRNFKKEELTCRCCNAEGVTQQLLDTLQALRDAVGRPLRINSGFRCRKHPVERGKTGYATHPLGLAADIAIPSGGTEALYRAILARPEIKGVGYDRVRNFFHIDLRPAPRRIFWRYEGSTPRPWNGVL